MNSESLQYHNSQTYANRVRMRITENYLTKIKEENGINSLQEKDDLFETNNHLNGIFTRLPNIHETQRFGVKKIITLVRIY